nr:hypothetical protein [Sphingomonas sp. OK281]
MISGRTVFDTTVIMEFLEDRWSVPALLPAERILSLPSVAATFTRVRGRGGTDG